jgi:hypothetical protein
MAKKTAFEDLFSDDFGKLGIERLQQLLVLAKELQASLKMAGNQLSKEIGSSKVQGSEDVAKHNKQLQDKKRIIDELTAAEAKELAIQKRIAELNTDNAKATAGYNLELKRQNQLLNENAILEDKNSTQYEKNIVLLNRLTKEVKGLGGLNKAPKAVADEFNRLQKEVEETEQSVKDFKRNVGNYSSATAELKALTRQLVDLELAGQRDSKAFREMQIRAAQLKDTISDTKAEINAMASDTRTIEGLTGAISLLAGGYEVVEGLSAVMGGNTEEWKESMVRLQAVMAVANGIQQVQNNLLKESAFMKLVDTVRTKALAAAETVYTFATGGATVATNALRVSMIALTGVGILALIVGVASAMSDVGEETEVAKESNDDYNDSVQKSIELLALRNKIELNHVGALEYTIKVQKMYIDGLKAKGATEREVFEAEQELRRKEQVDLQTRIDNLLNGKDTEINSIEDVAEAKLKFEIKYQELLQEVSLKREELFNAEMEFNRKETEESKKRTKERYEDKKKYIEKEIDLLKDAEQERRIKLASDMDASKRDAEVRNQLDQEKRRGLIDGYQEQKEDLVKAKDEDFELAKKATEIEFNARKKSLEKQAEFELQNAKLTSNEKELIQEKLKNDLAQIERQKQDEISAIQEQEESKRVQKEKESFDRRKKITQETIQALGKLNDELANKKLASIDSEINASEKRESQLQTLAQQGQLNAQQSIALEDKRQAELEAKREKTQRRRMQNAIILAGLEAFINSAQQGSTNPSGDSGQQVSDLLSNLSGAASKIQAFEKGGEIKGGEQFIRVNEKGEEFVMNDKAVKAYGSEFMHDVNNLKLDPLDYVSTPTSPKVSFVKSDNTELVQEIRELKMEVKNSKPDKVGISELTGGFLRESQENGRLLREHYKKGNRLF